MAQRLDRDRPLWETWVVEGLADGRWGLISKVHHCMVDGVAGTEIYHLLMSTSPEWQPCGERRPLPAPSAPPRTAVAATAAGQALLVPLRMVRLAAAAVRHPRRAVDLATTTARGLLADAHVVFPTRSSTLAGGIGRQRRYAATVVPLAELKAIGKRHGVTVNDVALAAATAGFRALLRERGDDCRPASVRSLVPVSVRPVGAEGELANRVSCMFADLPVHLADPEERLRQVHEQLLAAKRRHEAEAGEALVELSTRQPFAMLSPLLRLGFRLPQHSLVTVTTNVPGPREPLYVMGRRMLRLMPYVPIADRVRIGVAILSYCDEIAFGVTGDYDTTADVEVMLSAIRRDLDTLAPAAGVAVPV
jgi:diacylglycerol O-acyltransferase